MARVCAGAVMALGLLVITGWMLGLEPFKRVLPHLVAMKFNSALCFAMAGAALWWRRPGGVRQGLGGLVALVGALTLVQHLTGRNLGIDQMWMHDAAQPVGTPMPAGRMSFLSSICFFLCGSALVLLGRRRPPGWMWVELPAIATGAAGFTALLGYVFGVQQLYSLPGSVSMALHSAAGFVLLAGGLLCSFRGGTIDLLLRSRGAVRQLWLGFGVLTLLLVVLDIATATRLRAISRNVTAQAEIARPRAAVVRELEIRLHEFETSIRAYLAGYARGSALAMDAAKEVAANLAEYERLVQTARQRELAAQFTARWRELAALGEGLMATGRESSEELAHLTALLRQLKRFLGEEMKAEAIAAHDAAQAGTLRALQFTDALTLLMLIAGIVIALSTGGAVVRTVLAGQEALREREERFRSLFEGSLDAVFSLGANGHFVTANPSALRLAGRTLEELKKVHFLELCAPDRREAAADAFRAAFCRQCLSLETAVIDPAGTRHELFLSGAPAVVDGVVAGVSCIARDVTERHKAREQQEAEQARLQAVLDSLPVAVWIADQKANVVQTNRAVEKVWGEKPVPYGLDEYRVYQGWWADNGRPLAAEDWALARAVLKGEVSTGEVIHISRFNGERGTILNNAAPVRDAQGRILGGVAVAQDITELRQAQEDLRRSEERWNAAIENFGEGAIIATEAERVIYWNPAARSLHGLTSAEEGLGPLEEAANLFELWTMDGSRRLALEDWPMRRIKRGEQLRAQELRLRRPDQGWEKFVSYSGALVEMAGGERLIFLSVHDLTSLKQTEHALREREALVQKALAAPTVGVLFFRLDGRIQKASEAFERMIGYSTEELAHGAHWMSLTAPEHWEVTERTAAALAERGEAQPYEKQMIRKDGSRFWGLFAPTRLRGSGPDTECVEFIIDITERQQAQADLRRAHERTETILRSITDAFIALDHEWRFTYANAEAERKLRRSGAELLGRSIWEQFPGAEAFRKEYEQALASRQARHFEEFYSPLQTWFEVHAYPSPDGLSVYFRDVSERRRAAEALSQSEFFHRQTLESIPGMMFTTRPDGYCDWQSPQWEEFTGVPVEQDLGDGWNKLLHPDDAPRAFAAWRAAVEGRAPYDLEYRVRRYDGVYRWFKVRARPIRDPEGRIVRWFGVLLDIEDVKAAEAALAASLEEKVVLLREVHHRVKNNMQVISSMVNLQADGLMDPRLSAVFQDVRDRVRSMALVHEKLYQSENLAQIDFAEYARSLLAALYEGHRSGTATVRVEVEAPQPVLLTVDAAVPCGLILNELTTNALKYAFQGRAGGSVTVSIQRSPDDQVRVAVRDNGVGLPAGLDWKQTKSLGLRLVQILARQLQGTVALRQEAGTEFAVTFTSRTSGSKNGAPADQ